MGTGLDSATVTHTCWIRGIRHPVHDTVNLVGLGRNRADGRGWEDRASVGIEAHTLAVDYRRLDQPGRLLRAPCGRNERRFSVIWWMPRRSPAPAQPEVQRQAASDLPGVLQIPLGRRVDFIHREAAVGFL